MAAPLSDYLTIEWSPAGTPTEADPSALTWVEITNRVSSGQWSIGRDDDLDAYFVGSARVDIVNATENLAQLFDPDGWYRRRRIRAKLSDGHILWDHFIADVEHDTSNYPILGRAKVTTDDILGLLRDAEGAASTGAGTEGGHIEMWDEDGFGTLLDVIDQALNSSNGLHLSGESVYDYLETTLTRMPYWIPNDRSGNAWERLRSYLNSELASLHADPVNGRRVKLIHRWHPLRLLENLGTPSVVFSDTPTPTEYGYFGGSAEFASPARVYANSVALRWTEGALISVADGAEVADKGRDSFPSRVDLKSTDDNWNLATADLLLGLRSQTTRYPRKVKTLGWGLGQDPTGSDPIKARLGDYHQVKVTDPGGTQQTYDVIVEGIQHEFANDHWHVTFQYSSLGHWAVVYPGAVGNGLITVGGDAAHGIESDAILGP